MKKLSTFIAEKKATTVVISFGRMNPMTNGHEKLADKLKSEAKSRGAEAKLYLSHSTNPKKDPLPYDTKVKFAKKAFGPIVQNSPARTIIEVAKELSGKYDTLVVVVGSDRIPEFKSLLTKYNGKDYTFSSIEIVSAGERDPDAEGVTGMSGSKMRGFVASDDFNNFKKGVPSKLSDADAKQLFDAVGKGMKLNEETNLDEAVLSIAARRKRGMILRRRKSQIARQRKLAMNRYADKERIGRRAKRSAKSFFRKRFSAGADYKSMSAAQKITVDKRLEKLKGIIGKVATRLTPDVRRREIQRKANKMRSESLDTNFENFFLTEADQRTARLDQLIRYGLADKTMLSTIKIAMGKLSSGEVLSPRERKATENLVNTLVDMVTSSDALFRMTKSQLQKESVELNELSYSGNIGIMEMVKFYQKASEEQKNQMKKLLESKKTAEALRLLEKVTGTKLQEETYESDLYEDDDKYDDPATDGIHMAMVELDTLIEDAETIEMMLEDMEEEPDAWILSKITKATDYITTVRDYLDYYADDEDDEEEDGEDDIESEYEEMDVYEAVRTMDRDMFTEEELHELAPIFETIDGLEKKSDKSGISYSILKQVYDRGADTWVEQCNMTVEQWAFARVNTFIVGGKTDADLWEKVQLNNMFTEKVLEWGTDDARIAYAQATPGQSSEIVDAKYSADTALKVMNNANTQRIKKLFDEETEDCCGDCKDSDELTEEVNWKQVLTEAEYQGKKVSLNKPFYTPDGPKKSAVYTMGPNGKVVIVRFGDPNMEIKRDNPERRSNFRARHNCDDPGPKWKARYWSCKAW